MIMARLNLKQIMRSPPVTIAGLALFAMIAFFAVAHLVNRFGEQEKALARHLYDQGLTVRSGAVYWTARRWRLRRGDARS